MMLKIMVALTNTLTMVMIVIMIMKMTMMMVIIIMKNIIEQTCQVLYNFVPSSISVELDGGHRMQDSESLCKIFIL